MGSKSSTQKTESNPPKYALPVMERGAQDALALYNSGKGYNVYDGPTQAQFSPTSLQGMNALLAATGGGAPITNEGVFNTPQIQQAQQAIAAVKAKNAAAQPAPASGPGVWLQQQGGERRQGGREGSNVPVMYYINTVTGERSDKPPQAYIDQQRKAQSGGNLW
ncbi:hypothetical protein C1M53_31405 [Mesorhizobium sp. Pch-S]|nr:hypothetical protein C1M53_31405 [Mesorhizobium sp. Pch-S]